MSGNAFLDWASLAISLFNTMLLSWLGLTVLLNAKRRSLGLWLAGSGLLGGALFFISHSAILGNGLNALNASLEVWWWLGWVPVIGLPYVWYVLVLWYASFWEQWRALYNRPQLWGFYAATVVGLSIVALLVFANPLPNLTQAARFDEAARYNTLGLSILVFLYPLFCILCIGLALIALWQSPTANPSQQWPSLQLARQRARPWLVVTAIVLLIVSLLVGWLMVTTVTNRFMLVDLQWLGWFDLIADVFIAVAVLASGQAISAYEIFTNQTLPRRGLSRHWWNMIALAAGCSVILSGALIWQLHGVYMLLLSVALITAFYALVSWRSFVERERTMKQLRPFVSSEGLYGQLLSATTSAAALVADAGAPFRALCGEVLGARRAYLVALGSLGPLVGKPLAFPAGLTAPEVSSDLLAQFQSPQTMCLPLDAKRFEGAQWAVPLWSERGLVGLLLLGEKMDGGLYTQEEIEIARASGERLVDSQASLALARRLVALQREHLVTSQMSDRRARRVLHDDVLPQLHAAMLSLNTVTGNGQSVAQALNLLSDSHQQIARLLREMPLATPEVAQLGLIGALRQLVQREWANAFEQVTWQIDAQAEAAVQQLPAAEAEVLFYAAREAIRNAARHGRGRDGARSLCLRVGAEIHDDLRITLEDNGVGVAAGEAGGGGAGQGLALHSALMAIIGGTLSVESAAGAYTRVRLALPQR